MVNDQHLVMTPDFERALEMLHGGKNLFLTGKAGTGKSTLIRLFLEQTSGVAVTVAPTGIAALNVDGYTIHRLFSFPIGVTEETVRSGDYYPGRFVKTLRELDTLVVDEVSMVRADLFDAMIAALERFGPDPTKPLGGVQLVLVGDLYQLPPVVTESERQFIADTYGTPFFFSASSFDPEVFPTLELGEVFRQSGEDTLVAILNAVREGALLEDARAELNERTKPDFEPDPDEFWLTLTTTNRIADARNKAMLSRLPHEPTAFRASVIGDLDRFEKPVEMSLFLAPGAQVMLLNNDSGGRWVNGTIGRIVSIEGDERDPTINVELRNGEVVSVRRHLWEITRPYVEDGKLRHRVVGSFDQVPMKLAWAVTIHKSQGQTLDNVVVDLTGGTFANGQLYVALSRCTSMEGLVLKRSVLPRDLKTDRRVRGFLAPSATPQRTATADVYIAALTVGNEGRQHRPRPIEIALVTSDGYEAVSVINPTSDLYEAEAAFGLGVADVQLAPLLSEAWPAFAPLLAGRVPAGVRIEETLGLLDYELKRCGVVSVMPTARQTPEWVLTPVDQQRLNAPYALERARAMRDVDARLGVAHGSGGTAFSASEGGGYLQVRLDGWGGNPAPTGFGVAPASPADEPRLVLGAFLQGAFARVLDPDPSLVERVRAVEGHYGLNILPRGFELRRRMTVDDVLVPGARLCFTGTVSSSPYGAFSREEMYDLARREGMLISENMTKTRTDVLVVAQQGSQSRKAQRAAEWGKPIITAPDFLAWALG